MEIFPVEEILGRQVARAQVGDAGVQEGVEIGENDRLQLRPGLLAPSGFTQLLDGRVGQISLY